MGPVGPFSVPLWPGDLMFDTPGLYRSNKKVHVLFFLSIKRSVHPFCLLVELMMFSKKINTMSLKRIFFL